jgi:hypothetical protein
MHEGRRVKVAWRWLRPLLPYAGAAVVFSWFMVLVAWALMPSARAVELVIPPGTAERIARGETVPTIPDDLLLRRGDTLVLVNQDFESHRIGSIWIAPESSTRAPVTPALFEQSSLVCSFHPGGAIGVSPQSRPGLEATAVPAMIIAVPLSLAVIVTGGTVRRLDTS